jgi:hypothetical protein
MLLEGQMTPPKSYSNWGGGEDVGKPNIGSEKTSPFSAGKVLPHRK